VRCTIQAITNHGMCWEAVLVECMFAVEQYNIAGISQIYKNIIIICINKTTTKKNK
jgi:hypothetical protein